jgi:hypothetical protein
MRYAYTSTGLSTPSNSAACRVKPRSVGSEPSTVPSGVLPEAIQNCRAVSSQSI